MNFTILLFSNQKKSTKEYKRNELEEIKLVVFSGYDTARKNDKSIKLFHKTYTVLKEYYCIGFRGNRSLEIENTTPQRFDVILDFFQDNHLETNYIDALV
jgi:hypothetical protein